MSNEENKIRNEGRMQGRAANKKKGLQKGGKREKEKKVKMTEG